MKRNELIKTLKLNKVNKNEYLKRLETKYIKKGKTKSFKEEYLNGEGNELNYKFYSPISSSRLCFELFSWMANDNNILDLEFEYYLPGLKSIHGRNVKAPNMDVYYENDQINFVESKFTELALNKKEYISKNYYDYYLDGKNNIGKQLTEIALIRFDGNIIFAKRFTTLINQILEYAETNNLLNKYEWFNLKQEITHIFGIGQYIYKYKPNKNINFYNLIYSFDYQIDNLAYKFKELVNEMMNKYINDLNLNITFNYDFKFMQDYIYEIDLNKKSFASNITIKERLKEFLL